MKPRDLLLLATILLLLGGTAAWIVLSGGPAEAATRAEETTSDERVPAAAHPAPQVVTAPTVAASPLRATAERSEDTREWTSGMIVGDIRLAVNALAQIESITVSVVEAINSLPGMPAQRAPYTKSLLVPMEKNGATPTFELRDVPFSPYGYFVSAFAPGLNGSEAVVQVTKARPIVDVVLAVTCGVPFTILVRDQQKSPVADVLVTLMPDGAPLGRPMQQKQSDSYGAATFESVLRGPYKLIAGPLHAKLGEMPYDVQADGGRNVQCATLLAPRGSDLRVEVFTPSGMGLAEAELELYATDTTLWRQQKAQTDVSGQHTFKHVPPGSYHLNIRKAGYDHWARSCEVPDGQPAKPVTARLVPGN